MDKMALVKRLIKNIKTDSPFEICSCLNFIILDVPLIGIRGFYQYYNKNNIVYLSDNLEEHTKKFVCAHELGHAIMHRNTNEIFMDTRTFLKTSIYEHQADRFAIDLLLPNDDFMDGFEELSLSQIAHCYDVSEELMQYRICQIKNKPVY